MSQPIPSSPRSFAIDPIPSQRADAAAIPATVTCPACGRALAGARPVARFSSQQAADHFCPVIRNAARNAAFRASVEALWARDFVEVYECDACTHGFAWPHVAGDARFYGLMHEQAGYPSARWEYDAFVNRLAGRPPGRHLDIGTGDGSFLSQLPAGWQPFATESTDAMRRALEARGIKTFASVADVARDEPGTFDSVTMFQVIEHIADFKPLLAEIRAALKPGGLIGLSVPNGATKAAQERLTRCADMPPNHVNRWTAKSMTHVLNAAGFVDAQVTMRPSTLDNLVQAASLKTLGTAVNRPRSLTAQAYRVRNRTARLALFSIAGGFHLLSLLPHRRELMLPQEFLCVARVP